MAVLDVLNLNLGTEQNPNWVLHDLHDKRISTTAVTTATHLLATNAGVTAMNPITAANIASILGAAIPKGSVTAIGDFNLVTDSGCYSCNPSSMQNTPVSAPQGILSVYPTATGLKQQLIATSGIWERVFYSQTWWDWNRTDNFGCNNTDELASLLGGVTTDVSDFSLATQGCVSRIQTGVDGGRPADCSTEYSFFLFKISSNYILGFSSETGISYIKTRTTTSSAWSAWQKISVDIPSFYKNYNSLDALKNAVSTLLVFDHTTDTTGSCNDFTTTGIYSIGNNTECPINNRPSDGSGLIIVFTYNTWVGQIHFNYSGQWYKRRRVNVAWSEWTKF